MHTCRRLYDNIVDNPDTEFTEWQWIEPVPVEDPAESQL